MIKDVKLVELVAHVDDRGYLIEIIRANDSHFTKFGQVYLVGNFARGVAEFILRDDRPDSPTYEEMNSFVLSSRNPSLLVVPPGVYHGWMSLEDDTQMVSTASEVYNRDNPDEVRVSPNSFGVEWEIKGR